MFVFCLFQTVLLAFKDKACLTDLINSLCYVLPSRLLGASEQCIIYLAKNSAHLDFRLNSVMNLMLYYFVTIGLIPN